MPEQGSKALTATVAILRQAVDSRTLGKPAALPVTVTVASSELDSDPHVVVDVAGVRTAHIRLPVIQRASDEGTSPLSLLTLAVAEPEPLDEKGISRPIGTGIRPETSLLDEYRRVYRPTSVIDQLDRCLDSGIDAVVVGDQGSGVMELVAVWADRRDEDGRWGLIWLNASDPADGPESIYETLLVMPARDSYLVVVNGVESNPQSLKRIRSCVDELRRTYRLSVVLVATAWPSVVARLRHQFVGLRQINADGAELIDVMLHDVDLLPGERVAFRTLVGTNVHLARAALELHERTGIVPDRSRLRAAVIGTVADQDQEMLYWFACLSVFGIDVPAYLAERRFGRHAVGELVARRLLWLSDSAYTIGSRTRAGLIIELAQSEWEVKARWRDTVDLVSEYLITASEAEIIAMLERLDLVGLIDDTQASEGSRYLAMAWTQRARLVRNLAAYYTGDRDSNDCIGAAVFAAEAFANTNNLPAWRAVAAYVRGRFTYDGTDLPVPVGGLTSDFEDFRHIQSAMARADRDSEVAGWERAGDVDTDRCYRLWVLGLLLGFEGRALEPDPERLANLKAIAEAQQNAGGWFYPRRLVWVTARIVLGLCQAGETYLTSPVVRLACDWLRGRAETGGSLFESWWRSGSSPWNSDEAATAMCLTALRRAGAPPTPAVQTAMVWLHQRRFEWMRPDHEVDLALAIEAMLLHRADGDDLHNSVLALLQWAVNVPDGGLPTAGSTIPEDNLRLPFVASQLTVVIWETVRRNLRAVIQHELQRYRPDDPPAPATPPSSPPPPPPPTAAGADGTAPTETPLEPPAHGQAQSNPATTNAWQSAVGLIRDRLFREISARNLSKDTPEVAARIAELEADLARLNELSGDVSLGRLASVVDELEALGRRILGGFWPNPPRPA